MKRFNTYKTSVNEGNKKPIESQKEILENCPMFIELYNDVKDWTQNYKDVIVSDIESHIYGHVAYACFKIIIDGTSQIQDFDDTFNKNVLMVQTEKKGHVSLYLKKKHVYEWEIISLFTEFTQVIKEMNKLRDKGINEGIRDKMVPKSKEEIDRILRKRKKFIVDALKLNNGLKKLCFDIEYHIEYIDKYRQIIHTIETLYEDHVEVEVYDTELGEIIERYNVKYDDLSNEIITQIKQIIMNAIKHKSIKGEELVNEGIRDLMTPKPDEYIEKRLEELLEFVYRNEKLPGYTELDFFDPDMKKYFEKYLIGEDDDGINYLLYKDRVFKIGPLNSPKYHTYIMKVNDTLDNIETKLHINEGIRDLMTPKSKDDISKGIDRLYGQELVDYISKFINERDNELLSLILKSIDFSRLTDYEVYDLVEECIYLRLNRKVIRLFLKKGLSQALLSKLYDFATENGASEIATCIMDHIKANEGVRDMMTPKSETEIRDSVKGMSPEDKLLRGCLYGYNWLVQNALDEGADIDYLNTHGVGALQIASYNGHIDIVRLLLDKGINLNTDNLKARLNSPFFSATDPRLTTGQSALRDACVNSHMDIIQLLLDSGVYPNFEEWDWHSRSVMTHEVYTLLNKYKKTNESIRDKMTPISDSQIDDLLKGKSFKQALNKVTKSKEPDLIMKVMKSDFVTSRQIDDVDLIFNKLVMKNYCRISHKPKLDFEMDVTYSGKVDITRSDNDFLHSVKVGIVRLNEVMINYHQLNSKKGFPVFWYFVFLQVGANREKLRWRNMYFDNVDDMMDYIKKSGLDV